MNLGELFVTLGAKTDQSWSSAMSKLKEMGNAAKRTSDQIAAAAKAETSAIRQMNNALAGMRTPNMRTPNLARSGRTWGQVHSAMGLPPGLLNRLATSTPSNTNWATSTGDPFAVAAPPGKPGPKPRTPRPGAPTVGGLGFGGLLAATGAIGGASSFMRLSDVYQNLQNRIGGITNSQEQANATFTRLRDIANSTRTGLEATGEAYVRLTNATEEMNLSDEDRFKLVSRINMMMSMSGASAQEAAAGTMQLSQALAKGKLDGDEFRSMAENTPNVLKQLRQSLGVTEGKLREMSKAGELTRDKIVKAFLKADGIEAAFKKTKSTFSQASEVFKNKLIEAFGRLAEDKELVAAFTGALKVLADALIVVANYAATALKGIADFVKALREGEPWAIALASAIGVTLLPSVISLLGYLLRLPAAFAAAAAAGKLFGQLGGGGGGASTAKSVAQVTAGHVLRAAALPAAVGAGLYYAGDAAGLNHEGFMSQMYRLQAQGGQYGSQAQAAANTNTNNVTINNTVTIESQTVDEGAKQLFENSMRHAGGTFNR